MGLELAQKGNITCNAICPGYVLTDLIHKQLKDTAKARGIPEVLTHCLHLYQSRRHGHDSFSIFFQLRLGLYLKQ